MEKPTKMETTPAQKTATTVKKAVVPKELHCARFVENKKVLDFDKWPKPVKMHYDQPKDKQEVHIPSIQTGSKNIRKKQLESFFRKKAEPKKAKEKTWSLSDAEENFSFVGARDVALSESSNYWIFVFEDKALRAYHISDWINFRNQRKARTLTLDEAERTVAKTEHLQKNWLLKKTEKLREHGEVKLEQENIREDEDASGGFSRGQSAQFKKFLKENDADDEVAEDHDWDFEDKVEDDDEALVDEEELIKEKEKNLEEKDTKDKDQLKSNLTETGKAIADLLKKDEMENDEGEDQSDEEEEVEDWKQDEFVSKRPASAMAASESEAKKVKATPAEVAPVSTGPQTGLNEEAVRQVLLMAGKITVKKLVDILKKKGLLETSLDKERLAGYVGRLATKFQDGNEKFLLLRDEFRMRPPGK